MRTLSFFPCARPHYIASNTGCYEKINTGNRVSSVKEVDLSLCVHLQDPSLDAVAAAFPNLETLCLNGCTGLVTFPSACAALQNLHTLQLAGAHIGIRWKSDEQRATAYNSRLPFATGIALQRCPALTSLDLSDNPGLSDAGVDALARAAPRLKELKLSRCQGLLHFPWSVLQCCREMRTLLLDGANVVVADTAMHIPAHMSMKKLDLHGCHRMMYVKLLLPAKRVALTGC